MLFENPVSKIQTMTDAMKSLDIIPECECFDSGIVRSIKMYETVGILSPPYMVSLVMGVASGMPANPEWLPLLLRELPHHAIWQVCAVILTTLTNFAFVFIVPTLPDSNYSIYL